MTEASAPDRPAGVTIRRVAPGDPLPTSDVVREAADDLARSRGWPNAPRGAIEHLLARGWRYGDAVTLVPASAPWGRWDRYVMSGADAPP